MGFAYNSNRTKTEHKRSRSDPGRDTPVATEAEVIVSDDSKSETALEDALAEGNSGNRTASFQQETQIYPSIRGTYGSEGQDSQYWGSLSDDQTLRTEEIARKLSEANERLAQWQAWAIQHGVPLPPSTHLPSSTQMDVSIARQVGLSLLPN